MCGIFLIFSKTNFASDTTSMQQMFANFKSIQPRGPDSYQIIITDNCLIGFHRLAINDTSKLGMQPFRLDGNLTMCNGEIYNYHELVQEHDVKPLTSRSDCEVLPHLLSRFTTKEALAMLDAVFALAHYDVGQKRITIARDRLGVKPVFYAENDKFFGVASETKALQGMSFDSIQTLLPGTYMQYSPLTGDRLVERFAAIEPVSHALSYDESRERIHTLLVDSVKKRMTSDREIGCLLSGGLDSSVVAAILAKEMKTQGKILRTFSVGFPDSTDIVYARKVAAHIGSDHHELLLEYHDALQRIPDVIRATETYDTTTIRASTPMFLLCEWISRNFPDKVIFSGEGSDELFCGYLYFHNAPTAEAARADSLRLLRELHLYDVLRADRCTAGNGLEFREPFLDQNLIDFVVGTDPAFTMPSSVSRNGENVTFEKTILREAFSSYLPEDVAWRRKAAFSDAVSSSEKPWYKWIQESVEGCEDGFITETGGTVESNYYKTVFRQSFPDYDPHTPLWLPRWCDVGSEPSATVLKVYRKEEH